MEHRFGRAPAFALGVEEELLLVDPVEHRLAHVASRLLPAIVAPAGEVKPDTYEATVELASPIARDAEEAVRALSALRAAAAAGGATLLGAGIHPEGAFGDVVHVPRARYRAIADAMRGLLARTPTCALHVHVSMPDPETAIRAHNRLRAELPLLQALAANSPFWHGADSGLRSARSALFRAYPGADVPRAFEDFDDYAATIDAVAEAGELEDYTFLWWDVRPHPQLGTVEIRAMDAQSSLATVDGLTALVQALARDAVEAPPTPAPPREALTHSSFRAARDGLDATIVGSDGRLRPMREIAREALARARASEGGPALEEIERVLRDGNGADRQRAAHRRGGMVEVLRALVAETAARWPGDDRRQTTDDRNG